MEKYYNREEELFHRETQQEVPLVELFHRETRQEVPLVELCHMVKCRQGVLPVELYHTEMLA